MALNGCYSCLKVYISLFSVRLLVITTIFSLHSFWSSQSTSSCGFSDSALSLSLFGFSSMNTSTYKWDQPFTNCQYQIPFVVSGDNYISLIFWVIIVNSDSADNVRPANGLLPGHLHHPWHWLSGNNQIHLQYFSSI